MAERNPIIERALKEGSHSGGQIGDISGGIPAQISVKSGGGTRKTTGTVLVYDPAVKKTAIVEATPSNLQAIEAGRQRTLTERGIINLAKRTGIRVSRSKQGYLQLTKKGQTVTVIPRGSRLYSVKESGKATAKINPNLLHLLSPKISIKKKEPLAKKPSTIEAFKPKSERERLGHVREKQLAAIRRSKPTAVEERVLRSFMLGAIGAARGVLGAVEAVKSPIKTVKAQIEALKIPRETFYYMGQQVRIDPVGTVVEFIVFSKTLDLVGKLGKRSPVGRYVREELYIRSQPKEIQPYIRKIIKSAKVQERINPYKVRSIKRVDFMEVKALTKTEARALKKTLQQTDSVVFGSVATRTLGRKRTPIPKDVDIATTNIRTFYNTFKRNLPKRLRNSIRLKGEKVIRRDGSSLLDIKNINRLYPQKIPFFRKGYLPVSTTITKVKKVKGRYLPVKGAGVSRILDIPTQKIVSLKNNIKLIGFGEQTTRKALGTIAVLIEKSVRRAKDPQGFVLGLRIQLEALKKIKPTNVISKTLLKRKIRILTDAIKVLESKKFQALLETKVAGISKRYPILKKINIKKLKKVKKVSTARKARNIVNRLRKSKIKQIAKNAGIKFKKQVSKLPQKAKRVSYLPKVKKAPSRLPSKLNSQQASSLVSRLPSKIPSAFAFKVASRLPSTIPSPIISKLISKTPKSSLSKLGSRLVKSGIPRSKIPRSALPISRLSSRIPTSRVPSSKIPPGRVPPKVPPPLRRLPTWKTKLPRGVKPIVNVIIRVGGRNRELKWKTTPNKTLRRITRLIDRTTTRSFQLKIIGTTKAKDINKVSLRKFRIRRGKDKRVLKFVEKSKYAIDTRGEKTGLKIAKLLKKRTRKRKKRR